MEPLDNVVDQAVIFIYPIFERITQQSGLHQSNLWMYEVGQRFDKICKFLNNPEKERVRSRVRGQYALANLEINYEEDVVGNRPRPQLFDL